MGSDKQKSREQLTQQRILQWQHNVLQMLIQLSVDDARRLLPEVAAKSDEMIIHILHKTRYENCDVPDKLRHESKDWLVSQGFTRFKGQPWPPEGELPRMVCQEVSDNHCPDCGSEGKCAPGCPTRLL